GRSAQANRSLDEDGGKRQVNTPSVRGFLTVCILALNGCAGYQLGPVNGLQAGEKSVQINPFPNHTIQPGLTDAVTMQLRKEIQRDGTYRLDTHTDPDLIVNGTITQYERLEVTLSSNDT